MSLGSVNKLGPHMIAGPLGAGGMATVFCGVRHFRH